MPFCFDLQSGLKTDFFRKLPRGLQVHVALIFNNDLIEKLQETARVPQGHVALIFQMEATRKSKGNCTGASKAISL